MWRDSIRGGVVAALLLLVVAGCGLAGTAGAQQPGRSAPGGQLAIVTAFYPFQFVAERVAGSHAAVVSLTAPGTEPHDLELSPRQVAAVADADLVIYERSFQAAVDDAIAQSGNPQVLDTTAVVPLEAHGGADEHGAVDPHVWLDPLRLWTIADAVADRLVALDPANAADYRRNASALEEDLGALDRSFRTGLTGCRRSEFVTTHAAFGYLSERYGLDQLAITGVAAESEAAPGRVAEIQGLARRYGITTIFYETLVSPAVADSIANDLGLRTDVLDPIEGLTPESRGTDYLSVMRANLSALRTANGCP